MVSNPTDSHRIRLRSMPWLKNQPWHTENEKERMEDLRDRLYINPKENRK